jgi:hypothetical protein
MRPWLCCLLSIGVGSWLAGSMVGSEATAADPAASQPRLQSFALTDQYGTNHNVSFPRERPLLLTVADRGGAEQMSGWLEPIHDFDATLLDIVGVAQLRAVPWLLRNRVQRELRRQYSHPLLLDWQGQLERTLGCRLDQANVFLIDGHGRIVHHQAGAASPGKIAELRAAVHRVLTAHASSEEPQAGRIVGGSQRGQGLRK